MRGYTHKASFYGVPCWYNVDTDEIRPRPAIFAIPLDLMLAVHGLFLLITPFVEPSFPIKLIEEINN